MYLKLTVLDLIFPKKCLDCKTPGRYICEECLLKVGQADYIALDTVSLFKYEGVVRKAIIALKYKYALEISEELSEIVVNELKKEGKWPKAILVPVPLHKKREKWRGFNQTEEIGKIIAKKMGWKYAPDLVIRKTFKKPQVELGKGERKKNVKGVFEVKKKEKIDENASYIIFDDVLTTGSTLKEIEKVLRKAGARHVFKLTVAK